MVIHPLELDAAKLDKLAEVLSSDPRYFSDENRTLAVAWRTLNHWFGGESVTEACEIGDFAGVMIFKDILPGHKCNLVVIDIDKRAWGRKVWSEAMAEIRDVMKSHDLNRVEVETVTERWAKFLQRHGFVMEGCRAKSYMMEGEPVDYYQLALIGGRNG